MLNRLTITMLFISSFLTATKQPTRINPAYLIIADNIQGEIVHTSKDGFFVGGTRVHKHNLDTSLQAITTPELQKLLKKGAGVKLLVTKADRGYAIKKYQALYKNGVFVKAS